MPVNMEIRAWSGEGGFPSCMSGWWQRQGALLAPDGSQAGAVGGTLCCLLWKLQPRVGSHVPRPSVRGWWGRTAASPARGAKCHPGEGLLCLPPMRLVSSPPHLGQLLWRVAVRCCPGLSVRQPHQPAGQGCLVVLLGGGNSPSPAPEPPLSFPSKRQIFLGEGGLLYPSFTPGGQLSHRSFPIAVFGGRSHRVSRNR